VWLRSDSPYKEADATLRTAAAVRKYRRSILLRKTRIQGTMRYGLCDVRNSPRLTEALKEDGPQLGKLSQYLSMPS
jgi:hypothetical protein